VVPFLLHFYKKLITDQGLTTVIQPENIGASVRQNAAPLSLEYGLNGEGTNNRGQRELTLTCTIYSRAGSEDMYRAKDALELLMTAQNLDQDNPGTEFRVSQVRLSGTRQLVRNELADALQIEYRLRLTDLRPSLHQKQ
jgi:hypothetical protein